MGDGLTMTRLEFIIDDGQGRRAIAFPAAPFTLGSDADCALRFSEARLLPRHAEVTTDQSGQWWIRDLTASGSVVVNDRPILDERLCAGDVVRVGAVVLRVADTGVQEHTRTVSGEMPTPAPHTEALAPGDVVDGRYRVVEHLATGGMGAVYRAEHVDLGRPVALKVMLPELSGDESLVARFKREAVASSRIGQHNIIDVFDFGRTADGRFYFVMEFLDGQTLKTALRADGPFPVARAVRVGQQLARAVAAAHRADVVHRDLKPENVMLLQRPGQPDFVKVLDFGVARLTADGPQMTAVGTVVGSPRYMAPEQVRGQPVTARADIYALGLILHELLNGRPTFDGDSAATSMAMQINATPPALRPPAGPAPAELERLIFQMLEKAPADRPASMDAVAATLTRIADTPTLGPGTAPMPAVDGVAPEAAPTTTSVEVLSTAPTLALPAERARIDQRPPPPARAPAAPSRAETAALPSTGEFRAAVAPSWRLLYVVLVLAAIGALVGAAAAHYWPRGDASSRSTAASKSAADAPPAETTPTAPADTPPDDAAPVEPAEAPPTLVQVTLESEQPAVEVYEGDVLLGTTPLTLSRARGSLMSLRFEARRHATQQKKLRFETDTTVRVSLTPTASGTPPPTPESKPKPKPKATPHDELKDLPF